jgi:peptidoglycan hydrolase CwlO-like protein
MFKKVLILFLLLSVTTTAYAETTQEREARLRSELAKVEQEQAETEATLKNAQGQTASIERDILILTTKIKAAKLNIQAKNIVIEQLTKDIGNKDKKILSLEERIARGRESLAQIYQKTYQLDSYSLPEIFLSQGSLTDFYADVDSFAAVETALKTTFEDIRDTKTQTETEKETLGKKKDNELDARAEIEQAKRSIEANEKEKQILLSYSKTTERAYQQILADKKAKAASIRAALFSLRDSAAIPFGDALKFAQEAQRATGIRPAFLLAIITQESNLGQNVGSCFVSDLTTGDGVGKNTGTFFEQVMKAPRDTVPFQQITDALGRKWAETAVSCPIGSTKYVKGRGFGGGMGPAQFIPSTWMLFKDRISASYSVVNPDPWSPEHAFAASAFYLTDLGASGGIYSGEIKAACRYYGTGGSTCTYGRQVMAKAANIQENMINPLQGL